MLVNAIQKEIELTGNAALVNKNINTIYFGGGTPSLLSAAELHALLHTIKTNFEVNEATEITLEANPDDVNATTLTQWLKEGINRISLGIQSFNDVELQWMNRAHNAQHALNSIDLIKEAGFTNLSVDLIFGSPLLSNEELRKNIDYILEKEIPHIACYALTVEKKTLLYHQIEKNNGLPIDDNHQSEQFNIMVAMLLAAGYEHYEISNFAKPGFRSQHNSSYWKGIPYWGFGPSAHSYDGMQKRRWNVSNNSLYTQSLKKGIIPFEEEILTPAQQKNETIMIGLRTMEGVNLDHFKTKFGEQDTVQLLHQAQPYIKNGQMILLEQHLFLSNSGKIFADGIAADLFTN
jgi:oxygen-independent coproporphyrinogen-3 oxidase